MRTFIGAAQLTGQLTAFEPNVQYPGCILRYCPDGIYNDGNTMPLVMVYGNEAFTEDSAKAALEQGFAALAADGSCNILFMSPVDGIWGPKDKEQYLSVVSNVDHNFGGENGLKDAINFMTRQPEGKKLLGNEGMVYLVGDGSGADFIAEYLLGDGLTVKTFFGMEQSFAPTAAMLCNSSAMPKLSGQGVPAYIVNGTAAQAEAFTASLQNEREATRIVISATSEVTKGFDAAQVTAAWQQLFFKVRRQDNGAGAELYDIPNYDADFELIEENPTISTGTIRAMIFLPKCLDQSKAWPMVFGFHGGGNSGLFHAWSSELPLIGAAEGFITIEVDQHVQRRPAEIVELLDYLLAKYPIIDAGKVYCTGFSMGSIKSWGCGLGYTTRFAGIAPMDASGHVVAEQLDTFDDVPVEYDHIIPTFYVAGEKDGLPVGPNQKGQDGEIYKGCNYLMNGLYKKNGTGSYEFDEAGDYYWGLKARTEDLVDGKYIAHGHYVANPDGVEYCAFCNVENQTHAQIAVSCRQAWAFLKKFRRNADGSITVE